MRQLILAVLGCCYLGAMGCATHMARPDAAAQLPELMLAPAQLGASISATQRLTFRATRAAQRPVTGSVDIVVEVDPASLRIAALALGRRVFALQWDGTTLKEQRDARVPAELTAARVMRDIQFAYWPAQAVRAALSPGWQLDARDASRELRSSGGDLLLRARYQGAMPWQGEVNIENFAEGYELVIQSSVLHD